MVLNERSLIYKKVRKKNQQIEVNMTEKYKFQVFITD